MLIKKSDEIKGSEITDKKLYLTRRNFMRAAALAGSTALTGLFYRELFVPSSAPIKKSSKIPDIQPSSVALEIGDKKLTSYERITHYNNFYEFSTYKGGVAARA